LLEFLYKIPNNFQAKVVSKELKYYILPIEKFKEIYDSNENMKNYFDNLVLTKMKWRIERFYEIRNLNFELIKNNAQKEEKERRNSLFLCQTSCKFKTSSLPKVDVHLKDNSSKLGEELKVKSKLQTNRALTELSVTSLKNKLNNNVNLVTQRGNERNSSNLSISPNYLFISEFNSTNTNIKKEKVGKRKISENLFCSNSTQKTEKKATSSNMIYNFTPNAKNSLNFKIKINSDYFSPTPRDQPIKTFYFNNNGNEKKKKRLVMKASIHLRVLVMKKIIQIT